MSFNKDFLKQYPGIKDYRSLVGKLYVEQNRSGLRIDTYIITDVSHDNADNMYITLYNIKENRIFTLTRTPKFFNDLIINKFYAIGYNWSAEILE